MNAFERGLSENYGIDIKNIIPYKDNFILNTPDKKFIMKRNKVSSQRIFFIHGVKEHLHNNGFVHIDRYMCNRDGNPFVCIDECNLTLCEMVEGREINFNIREETLEATKTLAYLHKASRGFLPLENIKMRDELGELPLCFSKRIEALKRLKKIASKIQNKFDRLYLEYVDYFCEVGLKAVKELYDSNYYELVEKAKIENQICHHDFTHQNIICMDDRMAVINFEQCCYELKIYDLANLIRRKMRKCNWNIEEASMIINRYKNIEELSNDEMKVLKIMLLFPQKLWRVANKYYNSKHVSSEKNLLLKLKEVIDEADCHKRFIDNFEKNF